MKTYVELGVGNRWLLSTEREFSDSSEVRVPGVDVKGKCRGVYLRIWLGKRVVIVEKRGVSIKSKDRSAVKFVIGVEVA